MTLSAPALRNDDFTAMRQAMVASQLRTTQVNDPRIVAAMAEVPRERFVPAHAAALAYVDRAVDLGQGRALNTPLATARLLVQARLQPSDRVLLIGAAAGYTAAVLASLVAEVVAVESLPALAAHARDALAGTPNVTLVEGPLEHGHPAGAPYDVLIVDGAIEELPSTLASQVVDGGRIVSGIVDRGVFRLAAGTHRGVATALTPFADIDSVRLPGFARPRSFTF
ncbi:protein-L-isoaspartate O-methyltransferase [Sphingomonas endophytica]|jgi:protein-L-isoaspartate(D-aspartate) O-methyltransferase|uniref:Protein-L-isoaspartate O-methyltransferase n=1 Tax=Sphingomonas endophytica TaxID=869719 RepID=A0ABR6N2R9_9SPHN|nr:protein-L-isoaspartate O-methyltransferase [Sphingomonas endophytica]MBB5725075.1 protein-L-isoaspartate(D-aspartate) O-methyltransferase [Sphingomonas endophytica]